MGPEADQIRLDDPPGDAEKHGRDAGGDQHLDPDAGFRRRTFGVPRFRIGFRMIPERQDGEKDHPKDLCMVGIKKEGWINIYETVSERCIGAVHKSKEEAMRVKVNEKGVTYKDTVRVEWEE